MGVKKSQIIPQEEELINNADFLDETEYQKVRRAVTLTALRYTGNNIEEAEDLIQEALYRVFLRTQTHGKLQNPIAYLKLVIRRLYIDQFRHKRKNLMMLSLTDSASESPERFFPVEHEDQFGNVENEEVSDAEWRELKKTLKNFSSTEKQIFRFYLNGWSVGEISRSLSDSGEDVEHTLYKLRLKLRNKLTSLRKGPKNQIRLINKIHTLFPAEKRKRYDELYARFQQDKLSNKEYAELKKLGDELEIINAKRLKYIGELAELRGVPFKETIQEFKN